jgi:hypothetical protein
VIVGGPVTGLAFVLGLIVTGLHAALSRPPQDDE